MEKCYDVYKEECQKENKNSVSSNKFRHIFTEKYNNKFKSPKTDTCSVCDNLNVYLKNSELSKDQKVTHKLRIKPELHYKKAKGGQNAIKMAKIEVTQTQSTYAIKFNLQQTFSTTKLSTGTTFCKKKIDVLL